jgi:membrane protein DedA with SNARE-associated domain
MGLDKIIAFLATYIIAVISWGGYAGIVLLMAIESACIPLPSEIIMPFSGYLVSIGELNLLGVATAGAIGCNLGSIPAYEIGRHGGRTAIERWGRYILLDKSDLDRAEWLFGRFGNITILVGRLLPVVRSFIALPAGIGKMPRIPFHIYTFIGSWPWCFGLAWVGMELGVRWNSDPTMKELFHKFDFLIVGIGLLVGILFIWHRWKNRVRATPEEGQ